MRRTSRLAPLALAGWLLAPVFAHAQQAWLQPKGEGSFSLGFSHNFASEHLDYQGNSLSPGDMQWNGIGTDLGYSVTDRFAVRLSLPYMVSKYDGKFPHPARAGHTNLDDGSWHGALQDFRGEVRFKATKGSITLTPFAALIVPSRQTHSLTLAIRIHLASTPLAGARGLDDPTHAGRRPALP